jgi:hypothetical protein
MVKMAKRGRRHQAPWLTLMRPTFTGASAPKHELNEGDFPFYCFTPGDPRVLILQAFEAQSSQTKLESLIETCGARLVTQLGKVFFMTPQFRAFRESGAWTFDDQFLTRALFIPDSAGPGPWDWEVGFESGIEQI